MTRGRWVGSDATDAILESARPTHRRRFPRKRTRRATSIEADAVNALLRVFLPAAYVAQLAREERLRQSCGRDVIETTGREVREIAA